MAPGTRPSKEAGARGLLDAFAAGDPEDRVRLGEVFNGLGKRSFGLPPVVRVAIVGHRAQVPQPGGVVLLQLVVGARRPVEPCRPIVGATHSGGG